ncbi:MAG TPA: hypothetical protein VKP02_07535 [Gemmatimonadaceae bacterium]|nr:hypothetical protein [Gemmatimonadaceae bacterium]
MTTRPGTRALTFTLATVALVTLAVVWCAHPICMPLSAADVAEAAKWMPLEKRTDRQLHGPIFQKRGGQWYQCKSWISREFFF